MKPSYHGQKIFSLLQRNFVLQFRHLKCHMKLEKTSLDSLDQPRGMSEHQLCRFYDNFSR